VSHIRCCLINHRIRFRTVAPRAEVYGLEKRYTLLFLISKFEFMFGKRWGGGNNLKEMYTVRRIVYTHPLLYAKKIIEFERF